MKLFRHAAIVSLFTGLSRILGFLREMVMAHYFGTSLAKSAFDVAFRVPNLFRRLFGEGALSGAFVPVFAETINNEGREQANRLAGKVIAMLALFLSLITGAGIVIISISLHHTAAGSRSAAVLPLMRIMLPYMVFICLVALCMGILNAVGHFAVSAATPLILNLVWIASVYLLCPHLGKTPADRIYGVAWGVLFAGVLQLAVQLPILMRLKVLPRPSFAWHDRRIREILLLFGPAALGMGVHQINVVIDSVLALWAGAWAPAALGYAERLVYLPLGLFATALSTVLLPTFSKQAASNQVDHIPQTLSRSLYGLMLIMVPAAVGLIALADPIVALAFQSGEFDAQSSMLTARALRFYAPGLIVFSLYKVLVPAFYALKDTRTPVRMGLLAVGLNTALNVLLVITLPPLYKHAGLAMATVFSSGINGLLLAIVLSRRIGAVGWRRLGISLLKITFFCLLMAAAISHGYIRIKALEWLDATTKTGQAIQVGMAIILGISIYGACVMLFGRNELKKLRQKR